MIDFATLRVILLAALAAVGGATWLGLSWRADLKETGAAECRQKVSEAEHAALLRDRERLARLLDEAQHARSEDALTLAALKVQARSQHEELNRLKGASRCTIPPEKLKILLAPVTAGQ